MQMNRKSSYELSLSACIILAFSAQSILLAPNTQSIILQGLPSWFIACLAVIFLGLTVLLTASVLLNFSDKIFWITQVLAGLMLGLLSIIYLIQKQYAESILLFGMAIGFILSSKANVYHYNWLILVIVPANLTIGLFLVLSPGMLNAPLAYSSEQVTAIAFGSAFLLATLLGLLLIIKPELGTASRIRLLSIPWWLWTAYYVYPPQLPNLVAVSGVALGLLSFGFIPWNQIVLTEGKDLGRRFYWLLTTGQFFLLGFIVLLLHTIESRIPEVAGQIISIREMTLLIYNITGLLSIFVIASINMSINGMFAGLNGENLGTTPPTGKWKGWQAILKIFSQPFDISHSISHSFMSEQAKRKQEVEDLLNRQVINEKRRTAQLNLLRQLNHDLENSYEMQVSSQITANAIYNLVGGEIIAVFKYDEEREELETVAVTGPQAWTIPTEYRQSVRTGVIGRAVRHRRTQLISDTRLDNDYIRLDNQNYLSEIAVPLIFNNQVRGVLVISHIAPNVFDENDIRTLETVALRLVTSWHRNEHDQHMTELIQAGITLSTMQEIDQAIQEIADVAQKALVARFVFVALADKGGGFTRVAHAGFAPTLLGILNSNPGRNTLIQSVANSAGPIRMRDIRKKYPTTPTGDPELRSLLGIPIRMRQSSVGAILAFGKRGSMNFNESDESLASLLSNQAGAAVESAWLYQEIKTMFNRATLLYQLSTRVIQAEQLTDAATAIAETSYQMAGAYAVGIVLLAHNQKDIEVKVQIDGNGPHPGAKHPMESIHQALDISQHIFEGGVNNRGILCLPLQTPRRQYGALWMEIEEQKWENSSFADNMQTMANQAAIALERSILLAETLHQAGQLEAAYLKLQDTYDQTLSALSAALDARDRETEGHSRRVSRLSFILGLHMGMDEDHAKIMERGAILHDIGKIGVSDTILLKPGKLTEEEWQKMRQHPDIGARIIERIPFLQDAMPVIRYHHERWDGSGYPMGLKGTEIPLEARIFSIVDAFDALTSIRPYREKISYEEAIEYLKSKGNEHFDLEIVLMFEKLYYEGKLNDILHHG